LNEIKFGKGFDSNTSPLDKTLVDVTLRGADFSTVGMLSENKYGVVPRELGDLYNRAVVNHGLAKSRGELKSLNLIDLREFYYGSVKDAEAREPKGTEFPVTEILSALRTATDGIDKETVYNEYGTCLVIHCFEEGTIWLTQKQFVYWRVLDIDLEHNVVVTFVKRYLSGSYQWMPQEEGVLHIYLDPSDKPQTLHDGDTGDTYEIPYNVFVEDYKSMPELLTLLDPVKDLNWSREQQIVFNSTILTKAIVNEKLAGEQNTSAFKVLSTLFATIIFTINLKLYAEKPKIVRRKSGKVTAEACSKEELNKSKMLTRYVGNIRIKSEKVPKLPTKDTVVKYKTPVWHARGGVRHLKDGRVIHFKESVRHRKCLMEKFPEQNFDTPQSVITIRKDEGKTE
jgi:hypothetical protein